MADFNKNILEWVNYDNKIKTNNEVVKELRLKKDSLETNIIGYKNSHVYNEYKCCPNEFWPVTIFDINMSRNSHKYDIIIIMNDILVLSAFCSFLYIDSLNGSVHLWMITIILF